MIDKIIAKRKFRLTKSGSKYIEIKVVQEYENDIYSIYYDYAPKNLSRREQLIVNSIIADGIFEDKSSKMFGDEQLIKSYVARDIGETFYYEEDALEYFYAICDVLEALEDDNEYPLEFSNSIIKENRIRNQRFL